MAPSEGGCRLPEGAWQAALGRELVSLFRESYGTADREVRFALSPYRVCPLGAHVDHQLGVVSGMAIDRGILLTFSPNDVRCLRVRSRDFPGTVDFSLDDVPARRRGDWGNYARGAVVALKEHFELDTGIDAVIGGSMPVGGLSSSAAVGCAYLLALEQANGLEVDAATNISLDQRIENGYLGLNNGILDQSMILLAKRNHLTSLDCKTRETDSIPPADTLPAHDLLIAYSGVTEALTGTDYNQRVAECEEAAKRMLQLAGEPPPKRARLREVPKDVYEQERDKLPQELRRRATHFFSECERVEQGVAAWQAGDLEAFGRLVSQSGRSSIENYECGSPELTTLYEALRACEGVHGARFSGAGFRGSCLALSDPARREHIRREVTGKYRSVHPGPAAGMEIRFCASAGAAREVRLVA